MIREADETALAEASRLLQAGQLVAFPTETVYGLGANAGSSQAVQRIYDAKGRPSNNPLIVHVPDEAEARHITTAWPELAARLADAFWPGPLTLVTARGPLIPDIVSAGLPTVAVRVPAHPVALALLRACGLPLAAPSANRSEQISPTTALHVERAGLTGLELILDGGPCRCGIESTVVDLSGSRPRLLRPGALPLTALLPYIPDLILPGPLDPELPHASPGMMKRHYSPRARLLLVEDPDQIDLETLPAPLGLLTYFPPDEAWRVRARVVELLPEDPAGYAADLYAALHRLDDAGVATILAPLPPRGLAWTAIHDRLSRASA